MSTASRATGKRLYLQAVGGVSGDMLLAGLCDLGFDPARLTTALEQLGLPVVVLAEEAICQSIGGVRMRFEFPAAEQLRCLPDIERLLAGADHLSVAVKARVQSCFARLAAAEGQVHRIAPERVHFHEIGALDTIADILGVVLALEQLGVTECLVGPIPVASSGTVVTAHGRIPLPVPATLELLKGFTLTSTAADTELVTPTGAALLATCFTQQPVGEIGPYQVGYGVGSRTDAAWPSLVRVLLSELPLAEKVAEPLVMIECDIDDMSGEELASAGRALLAAGALDVTLGQQIMKKGRPGVRLSVLGRPQQQQVLVDAILQQTTTFGVRYYPVLRQHLVREMVDVATAYGVVPVKVGQLGAGRYRYHPEHDVLVALAAKHSVGLAEVKNEVLRAIKIKEKN